MGSTHITTTEWQSFEARMRRRRADRCLLRAEAAIEAGCLEDAREDLEEVRQLWPAAPHLPALEQRLADALAQVPSTGAGQVVLTRAELATSMGSTQQLPVVELLRTVEVELPQKSHGFHGAVAAVLALVLIGIVGTATWWGTRWYPWPALSGVGLAVESRGSDPLALPDKVQPQPAVAVSSTTAVVPEPVRDEPTKPKAVATPETEHVAAASRATPDAVGIPPSGDTAAAPPSVEVRSAPPPFANLPPPDVPPPPAPPSAPVSTAPPAADLAPAPALAPASAPAADPVPANVAAPPSAADAPPTVNEVERVRAVLNRYESAYTSLDARAAGAIYPRLDSGALARAFDGLSAQRVTLGRCDVVVNAMTAQANCSGSASWTPKVGGSSQTSARNWRFELRRVGDTWQIVGAVTR